MRCIIEEVNRTIRRLDLYGSRAVIKYMKNYIIIYKKHPGFHDRMYTAVDVYHSKYLDNLKKLLVLL